MNKAAQWADADSPAGGNEEIGLGFARAIWRRKWLVVSLMLIGAGLGYLYYGRAARVYQSSAQILLIQRKADLPVEGIEGEISYQNDLATHTYLLRSRMLIDRAVAKLDLNALPSLRDSRDPTAVIAGGLHVAPAGERYAWTDDILVLSYSGSHREDCPVILNAIIEAYQEFIGQTYQDFSKQTVELIVKAKDVLHKEMLEKEAKYQKFREDCPLLWKNDEAANLHETRLLQIEAARSQLLLKLTQTRARLDAISDAVAKGGSRAALALLIGGSKPDSPAGSVIEPRSEFERQLFMYMLDEQILLTDLGPDHYKVQTVRKRMDLIRKHIGASPLPEHGKEPPDFFSLYLDSLRHEIEISQQEIAKLDQHFEKEREASKSLASYKAADENYRKELDRIQRMFDTVMKRLEEIKLSVDIGEVSTEVISPPGVGVQIQPKLLVVEAIALLFGTLAGIVLAYVVDISDKTFRNPEDICCELGLPVLGHVPAMSRPAESRPAETKRETDIAETVWTFHDSKGPEAEAYQAIRTALYFDARRENNRVVQITSPEVGDGKTTLAANLAVSAANGGKRVLLLDADFRRPKIQKLFGLTGANGLARLLEGKVELDDVTRNTPVDNLWIIPCGKRVQNPADLLTAHRFAELVDVVREKYDMVILDSPPLLAVTDPAVIAPRVDTVVLVTRLANHTRKATGRAREMLVSLGANVLGIVVNGVKPRQKFGYRYGEYKYGDRYRYQYHDGPYCAATGATDAEDAETTVCG